jgi:hypothetical protein
MIRCVLDSVPRVSEAGRVEVADDGFAFAGRSGPSDPVGRAVGEPPTEEELEARGLPWSNACVSCPDRRRPAAFSSTVDFCLAQSDTWHDR